MSEESQEANAGFRTHTQKKENLRYRRASVNAMPATATPQHRNQHCVLSMYIVCRDCLIRQRIVPSLNPLLRQRISAMREMPIKKYFSKNKKSHYRVSNYFLSSFFAGVAGAVFAAGAAALPAEAVLAPGAAAFAPAGAGSAPSSPSSGFLPFAITSGSARVVAAVASAGVSSFNMVGGTTATIVLDSLSRIFTLSTLISRMWTD